jgi:hypothetical protein
VEEIFGVLPARGTSRQVDYFAASVLAHCLGLRPSTPRALLLFSPFLISRPSLSAPRTVLLSPKIRTSARAPDRMTASLSSSSIVATRHRILLDPRITPPQLHQASIASRASLLVAGPTGHSGPDVLTGAPGSWLNNMYASRQHLFLHHHMRGRPWSALFFAATEIQPHTASSNPRWFIRHSHKCWRLWQWVARLRTAVSAAQCSYSIFLEASIAQPAQSALASLR